VSDTRMVESAALRFDCVPVDGWVPPKAAKNTVTYKTPDIVGYYAI
jgi:hypothetical protein